MKLSNASILFVIIFFMLMYVIDVRAEKVKSATEENAYLNDCIDKAAFDAARGLVEKDTSAETVINKERALELFFKTLESNIGKAEGLSREELSFYIPVILITDTDGFYISYLDTANVNGENVYVRNWTEKIPYTVEYDDGYVYSYNIGNKKENVTLYDIYTMEVNSGHYADVALRCKAQKYLEKDVFENGRTSTVIAAIEDKMQYYINKHNLVAKRYGISYSFYLPEIDKESWLRTIDDISFFFLFQGYPYAGVSGEYFNRMAVAGSRIAKASTYYVNTVDGMLTYHKRGCLLISEDDTYTNYSSREECASHGAYPCGECKP